MIRLGKLSAALKKCNYIAWIKKNNHDYILSDYLILKTNQEIKGGALNKLVSSLGNVPVENKGIQNRHGYIREMTESEIDNMIGLLKSKDSKSIEFTNLVYQTDKDLFSIFKGKEDYIFINKLYIDIVDQYVKDLKIYGTNRVSPIYFYKENEEIMFLPIRLNNGEIPFYLKGESE